ncbi:MAG TPA: MBL fold metallo-hydrolase [Anaeromyxobacter sp.]|nr:MBL fold metallo-hydrolase [Anaeromyxobacter sp.]
MEEVTPNIFAETKTRGCNPGFVKTSKGVVVIDTPQLPTQAVAMRKLAESHGPIQYLINTEHHVDHIFGNYWFKGPWPIVHHQGVADNFMVVQPELDPYAYALEAIPTDDPAGAPLVPDRETYYADPGRGTIVFTGNVTLRVGRHTFHLLHTPGHTPGQIAVHIPEERVLFTGDTVFHKVQTWLMTSDVPNWIASLEKLRGLPDVDKIVPGHGPITTMKALDEQRAFLMEWVTAVAEAIGKGWSREEALKRVSFEGRFPVDIGQEYMMNYIQTLNVGSLYDKLTASRNPKR